MLKYIFTLIMFLCMIGSSIALQDFSGNVCSNKPKKVHCSFVGGRQVIFDPPIGSRTSGNAYTFSAYEKTPDNKCLIHLIANPCEMVCEVDMHNCE